MVTSRFSGRLQEVANQLIEKRMNGTSSLSISIEWSETVTNLLPVGLALTGSFGRREATFDSDLDLVQIGHRGSEPLRELSNSGLQLDSAGVTPDSSFIPQTEEAWRNQALDWALDPDKNRGVVLMGLLADMDHPVHFEAAQVVPETPIVGEMLRDAISTKPPRIAGLFSRGSINLKRDFLVPIVKLARWGNLASGRSDLKTIERLQNTNEEFLDKDSALGLASNFAKLHELKLDIEFGIAGDVIPGRNNQVLVHSLNSSQKKVLLSARKEISSAQSQLRYLLSTSTFTY